LDSMCGIVRAVEHMLCKTHTAYSLTLARDVWVLTNTQAHVSHVRADEYAGTLVWCRSLRIRRHTCLMCVLTNTQAHLSGAGVDEYAGTRVSCAC
jgi:hypothetical protein